MERSQRKWQIPPYQLHLAYSLKKNWWLKTGFRYSNYSYTNKFQFKTEYDKSKEYEKDDGTFANTVPLQTNNGHFNTRQDIEVNLPNDNALETGDWLFGEFEETQQISLCQMPLGIEYRKENHKLGWQIGASALLNMMSFSDVQLAGEIQSTQDKFATEIVNKEYGSSTTKLLLGAEGSVGLHYRLNKRFTLRTDALFQYNSNFQSRSIQVGVAYRI